MAKRRRGSEDASPHEKRRKLMATGSTKSSNEDILSVKQLRDLLAFSQDVGQNTRQNINAFKLFLESISYGDDAALRLSRRDILLQYLDPQPTSSSNRQLTDPSELLKSWSFAAQSNNEALYSAVTAVLALLLKTISHHLEFRDVGRDLCDLLLQTDQLNLLERGLSAKKSKDHVISPCLRLLTQIVSFDGGYSAKRIYRCKHVAFKRLNTFLSLRQDRKGLESKSRRKIPVRNLALQYLFANLRLQHHAIKTEILAHGRTLRSIFQDIKEDSRSIIQQILQVVKDDILKDEKIPRSVKGRLFTDQILASIATLYGYSNTDVDTKTDEVGQDLSDIPELAQNLLLSLCTRPEYGVLLRPEAQYPGAGSEEITSHAEVISKYHDIGPSSKRKHKRTVIRNNTLSVFLQTLRPYASSSQRDLILATFQAAPELISDYFYKKRAFSFEPKLTATWMGYAAFLLCTIQMPLPEQPENPNAFGLHPATISDLVDSILPLPLSSKIVSRCLNQNVIMIRFFAIKILTAAFDKFAQTLRYFRSMRQASRVFPEQVWDTAASELVEEFGQRCPDMNHVITVFRNCSSQEPLLREASARLLSLYYQHLPQTALEQKFDVSTALSGVLNGMTASPQGFVELGLTSMVLTNLLNVAQCSPDMRWWQKSEHDQVSLFGSAFRLCATLDDNSRIRSLLTLLQSALNQGLSLDPTHENLLLSILLESIVKLEDRSANEETTCLTSSPLSRQNYFLRPPISHERSPSPARSWSLDSEGVHTFLDDEEWQPSEALFKFLDSCLTRLTKKTVKYHQDLLGFVMEIGHSSTLDSDPVAGEFLMVVLEQWPFLEESAITPDFENISQWLTRFLLILTRNGEDSRFIDLFRSKIEALTASQQSRLWLGKAPEARFMKSLALKPVPLVFDERPQPVVLAAGQHHDDHAPSKSWHHPTPPASEGEDRPGLGKWRQASVEEAVVEGTVGELMLCLCSKYGEIRKQALIELRVLMKALQTCQYREREPIYLLVAELVETCKESTADKALPHFAGVMAAESCMVLSDPLHFLYSKVNKFLNKGPVWKVEKLPSYWVDGILMRLPTMDDVYYKEMEWLLNVLIEGLRTSVDMELYRRCHVLERLLCLVASPSLPRPHREKLLTLLYRCVYADGSTTLITRCSLLSWIRCCIAVDDMTGLQTSGLDDLAEACLQNCDRERVHDWSGGELSALPRTMQGSLVKIK